jgi:hypothetical protein
VHEGHVTRVDFAGQGMPVGMRLTPESAPSIDGLFDELEQASQNPESNLRVSFDPTLHIPTEANYMAATELVGFKVSGFEALTP